MNKICIFMSGWELSQQEKKSQVFQYDYDYNEIDLLSPHPQT